MRLIAVIGSVDLSGQLTGQVSLFVRSMNSVELDVGSGLEQNLSWYCGLLSPCHGWLD